MTRKRRSGETRHNLASKHVTLRIYPDRGKPAAKPKPEMPGQLPLFGGQEPDPGPPEDDPGRRAGAAPTEGTTT